MKDMIKTDASNQSADTNPAGIYLLKAAMEISERCVKPVQS